MFTPTHLFLKSISLTQHALLHTCPTPPRLTLVLCRTTLPLENQHSRVSDVQPPSPLHTTWSAKNRREHPVPALYRGEARIYNLKTTAMHDVITCPPPQDARIYSLKATHENEYTPPPKKKTPISIGRRRALPRGHRHLKTPPLRQHRDGERGRRHGRSRRA